MISFEQTLFLSKDKMSSVSIKLKGYGTPSFLITRIEKETEITKTRKGEIDSKENL